ncbi:hypothetical protein FJT64_015507 [Amphibalanus amphitrite]|uniref:Uncharacterized protein n=1 Tax=Amphibalanus amphitrite TaxID=1232801 RepID=A0A6A4XGP9_AMPAM|nr:hypothetical protein FJT64_015507 [Amphibalanus amphitrite]
MELGRGGPRGSSFDGPGTGMSYTELEAGYQGLRRAPAGFYIGDDAAAAIIRSSSSGLSAVLKPMPLPR